MRFENFFKQSGFYVLTAHILKNPFVESVAWFLTINAEETFWKIYLTGFKHSNFLFLAPALRKRVAE